MREALDVALIPPQAIEAEQSILGGLMLDPGAYDRIDWLPESAFYRKAHRVIYGTIRALLEEGKAVDTLLVCERLEAAKALDEVGGAEYVGSLPGNTPSAANIKRYAEIVQDRAIRRQVIAHAMDIAGRAYDASEDARALVTEAEDRFLSVLETGRSGELAPFSQAVGEAVDSMDEPERGLFTGYANIDRVWGGMQAGDLIIIAGRPSMGKSALAFNIAEHIAQTLPVMAFSLEMTRRAVAKRAVRYHRSLLGNTAGVTHLMAHKLWIDETPGIGVGYMRAKIKRLKRAHGLGLIVVDYLQLVAAKGENRTQEVAAISRGLKSIAKEYQVPVIAVSQLSRGVEARTDRRPVISDLRESGQVEQDADIIAFVYREDYYTPSTPMAGIAEVLTRKHREGATGTSYLHFMPEYARFKNMDGQLPCAPTVEPRKPRGRVVRITDTKKQAAGDVDG